MIGQSMCWYYWLYYFFPILYQPDVKSFKCLIVHFGYIVITRLNPGWLYWLLTVLKTSFQDKKTIHSFYKHMIHWKRKAVKNKMIWKNNLQNKSLFFPLCLSSSRNFKEKPESIRRKIFWVAEKFFSKKKKKKKKVNLITDLIFEVLIPFNWNESVKILHWMFFFGHLWPLKKKKKKKKKNAWFMLTVIGNFLLLKFKMPGPVMRANYFQQQNKCHLMYTWKKVWYNCDIKAIRNTTTYRSWRC